MAIYECHNGGAFDSTNVIEKPVITAITPIGEDHILQLGPTIEHIAWHKAGIMKPGTLALSVPQNLKVISVLRSRAKRIGTTIHEIELCQDSLLSPSVPSSQLMNYSLAQAASNGFLLQKSPGASLSQKDKREALRDYTWLGRFQEILIDGSLWFIDGAHNAMSLDECAKWFSSATGSDQDIYRILLFGTTPQRDGPELLGILADSLQSKGTEIDYSIFTVPSSPSLQSMRSQQASQDDSLSSTSSYPPVPDYTHMWNTYYSSRSQAIPNSQDAIDLVQTLSKEHPRAHILLTGSLRLVGDALRLLQPQVEGRK